MKNLIYFLLITAVSLPGLLIAQDTQECRTAEYLQKRIDDNPSLQRSIDGIIRQVETWMQNHPYDAHLHQIPVILPVVVHNVYKNNGDKLSQQAIRDQITLTNRHLARRASNLSSIPSVFRNRAQNTRVQLRLAVRGPNGAATNGITYKQTIVNLFTDDDKVKKSATGGTDPWDPDKYLNIWVCAIDGFCGYASFPYNYGGTTPDQYHGIVVDKDCWGESTGKQGTTLTHELGHFLGLKHIWGDANCGNDNVADTPKQKNPTRGCPTGVVAAECAGGDANGRMYQNIMDYTSCRSMITGGQARRMWGFLNYYTRRSNLLESEALMPVGGLTRRFTTDFISEYNSLPPWKAALAMVHGAAVGQCIPVSEINRLAQAGGTARGNRYSQLPSDLADAIFGFGLKAEEVLACYSARGFYDNLLNRGPVALIEINGTSIHGITITGMAVSGNASVVEISDPMNIGPRQFSLLGIEQRGHRKIATYASLANFMEKAASENRKIIFARPMSRVTPAR